MSPMNLRLCLLWTLGTGLAWGDESSNIDAVDETVEGAEPAPVDVESLCAGDLEIPALCQALRAAQVCPEPESEMTSECREEAQALRALLGDSTILLDDRGSLAQRREAAERLAESADPRATPFIRAASKSSEASVRALAVEVAPSWKSAETVDLLVHRARRESQKQIMDAAFQALQDLEIPEAGEALYLMAEDEDLPNHRRSRALTVLEESYPHLLAERGAPVQGADSRGTLAAVTANGLVGGVALGAVGVWGQSDAGVAIGALGGTAIGVGTGVLYAKSSPMSRGQGFRYASNVGWGTAGAILVNSIVDSEDNAAALVTTLGAVGGAVTGFGAMQRSPDAADVMEMNVTGYLGAQLARSTVLTAIDKKECFWEGSVDDPTDCVADQDRRLRAARIGMLAGSAGGLAFGHIMSPKWSPESSDVFFASSVGVQSAWLAGWLPVAIDLDREVAPLVNLGFHGGVSAALAAAHRSPVDVQTTTLMNYGFLAGNSLGAGLALIPANSQEQTIVRSMLGVGVLGSGVAALASPTLELSPGDTTMISVGTGLTMIQVASVAQVLEDYGVLQHSDQSVGLVLSAGSLSSAGLMALSSIVDPDPLDSLFIASTGGWGYWYSGLGMVALDPDLDDSAKLLIATASADLAMGVGGLILWDGTELQPRDTLLPQLVGVGGATIGSLVVALGSDDGQKIAWGALSGSLVGLATGSLLSFSVETEDTPSLTSMSGLIPDRALQRLDLPGEWSVSALPMLQEDGNLGGHVSIRGVGF